LFEKSFLKGDMSLRLVVPIEVPEKKTRSEWLEDKWSSFVGWAPVQVLLLSWVWLCCLRSPLHEPPFHDDRGMKEILQGADLLLVNGSSSDHLRAVMLQYNNSQMKAPTVILKTKGEAANQWVLGAYWAKLPVYEVPLLTAALFRAVPEGQMIGRVFHKGVAHYLAKAYKQRKLVSPTA